jgi:hypothetical protein
MSVTSDALTRAGKAPVAEPGTGDPTAVDSTTRSADEDAAPSRWRRLLASRDLRAIATFVLLAMWVTERFWRYMGRYQVADNGQDHIQFEYFLVRATRVVTKFENPFHLDQMNFPMGVNLMANTPAYGLTIPLVPVTLAFGPQVSFALMSLIALAATATAWYWFLSRHVVKSWPAALIGGLLCGFGPGMLSQALAHPNIAAQYTVPLILAQLIQLRAPGHTVRRGVILGLLVTYQAFLNEEILFFTALCCALFCGSWALIRREEAKAALRTFAAGLGIAGGVSVVLLAYPLYNQFFGPGAYHGMWDGAQRFGADIKSYALFPSVAFAGSPGNAKFSEGAAEQNAYFGYPLLVLLGLVVAVLWRKRPILVRAICVTGAFAFLMSLGPLLIFNRHRTSIPGPYAVVFHLPLFDSVIATRWSLVLIPLIAILLALWLDDLLTVARQAPPERARFVRMLAVGLVLVALLPLAPRRIHITGPAPIPQFFTTGEWRGYVPEGRSIVPVPLASNAHGEEPMRWATAAGLDFSMPGGYFLGPDPRTPDGRSMFGSPPRPTSELFIRVDKSGKVPPIGAAEKANAVADLKFWRAAIVVLPEQRAHEEALWKLTNSLLGFQPTWRNGIWVWDVRQLAS